MILTKSIKIIINQGNYPRYKQFKELKHIKIGDEIDIPIKFIAKSKNVKILVKCDNCEKEQYILYSTYNDSTKKQTESYYCKGKCSNIKREKTNMELYGVKNCFQNEKMKEKSKKTMKEKYGNEYNMQCEEFLDARKETYMKNWGVDNPSKSEKVKNKKIETCLKNYGVESPYQNKKIFDKSRTNGLKIKNYKNTDLVYQGSYEKNFLDNYYDKVKIENGISVNYIFESKNKTYHSDYYLPEYDLIVEIKSSYWYEYAKRKNIQKEKYSKIHHNYILILDKNYNEFNMIIHHN